MVAYLAQQVGGFGNSVIITSSVFIFGTKYYKIYMYVCMYVALILLEVVEYVIRTCNTCSNYKLQTLISSVYLLVCPNMEEKIARNLLNGICMY